jgi:hypothetical protein
MKEFSVRAVMPGNREAQYYVNADGLTDALVVADKLHSDEVAKTFGVKKSDITWEVEEGFC